MKHIHRRTAENGRGINGTGSFLWIILFVIMILCTCNALSNIGNSDYSIAQNNFYAQGDVK